MYDERDEKGEREDVGRTEDTDDLLEDLSARDAEDQVGTGDVGMPW